MERVRKIIFYGKYFEEFYGQQTKRAQEKIDQVLSLVTLVDNVPKKFFKYAEDTDGLFEIRISFGHSAFRIFCFFDIENTLILLNGFVKKKKKLPRNELFLADKLKKEYLFYKKHGDRTRD